MTLTAAFVIRQHCRFCVTESSPLGWYIIDGDQNRAVCAACCEQIKAGQSAIVDLFMKSSAYASVRMTEMSNMLNDYKQNGIRVVEFGET